MINYRTVWRSDWPPKERASASTAYYNTKEPGYPRSFQAHLDRGWLKLVKVLRFDKD